MNRLEEAEIKQGIYEAMRNDPSETKYVLDYRQKPDGYLNYTNTEVKPGEREGTWTSILIPEDDEEELMVSFLVEKFFNFFSKNFSEFKKTPKNATKFERLKSRSVCCLRRRNLVCWKTVKKWQIRNIKSNYHQHQKTLILIVNKHSLHLPPKTILHFLEITTINILFRVGKNGLGTRSAATKSAAGFAHGKL